MTVEELEKMTDLFLRNYNGITTGVSEPGDYVKDEWDLYHCAFIVTCHPDNRYDEYIYPAILSMSQNIQLEFGDKIQTRPYEKAKYHYTKNGLHIGVIIGPANGQPEVFQIYILVKKDVL